MCTLTMERADIRSRMAVSSVWSAVSSAGGQVVSFLVFVVITRLISREQFGLVALAGLLIDFMQIISAGGIPDAVIQRRVLTDDTADTAFWTNCASGIGFAGLAALLAGQLQALFAMPGLAHVIDLLAVTFLIAPLGAIHTARIARDFGFRALALRNLLSNVLSGGLGVWLALLGWGVDALCAQRIAALVCTTLISWAAYRWVPRLRFSRRTFRQLAGYGYPNVGATLFIQINIRLPELIAGFLLGPAAVGAIRVASRCVDMLGLLTVAPFQQTALPVLARVQHDEALRRTTYVDFSRLSAFAIFPVYAGAAALAPIGIGAIFGADWEAAGPIAQILCLVAVPVQFNVLLIAALGAAGQTRQILLWSIAQLAVGIGTSIPGAALGALGLVAANIVRGYALLPVGLVMLRLRAAIGPGTVLRSIAGPLLASLVMASAVLALRHALTGWLPVWSVLTVCIAVGGAIYGGLSLLVSPGQVQDLVALLPGRLRIRRA
jgi:O-antigen/teichoic acid export membrane protein